DARRAVVKLATDMDFTDLLVEDQHLRVGQHGGVGHAFKGVDEQRDAVLDQAKLQAVATDAAGGEALVVYSASVGICEDAVVVGTAKTVGETAGTGLRTSAAGSSAGRA